MSDEETPIFESGTSIDKALTVLEALVAEAPNAALADIAARAGFPKPNTHRILRTLVRRGYAHTEGQGKYRPGPKILALAGQVLLSLNYAVVAQPYLQRLHDQVQDTVHLALLDEERLYYVAKLDGSRPYRMRSAVGQELNLHSSSIGKAVLAALPGEERHMLLKGRALPQVTANTRTDHEAIEAEVARVRELGYAIDDNENDPGVRCVGASVYNALGRVIGGASISAPSFFLDGPEMARLAPLVIDVATDISEALGAPEALIAARRQLARTHLERLASGEAVVPLLSTPQS